MLRILYYSVHAILEDDEVRLLQGLGHDVCCMGINGPDGPTQNFRPAIHFSDRELDLYARGRDLGARFSSLIPYQDYVLPAAFIDLFDVVIVMHDVMFMHHFWAVLSRRPVIWRTIGQMMEGSEVAARPLREHGLFIARYSPVELDVPGTLGQDAIIRFSKSSITYGNWQGSDATVLNFCNNYRARYPREVDDYLDISRGFAVKLGGIGNDDMPGAIGMINWEMQVDLYRRSRVYLYASGLDVPYTLTFMEAWMSGMPIVVYAPLERCGPFFEIDRLVTDGVDGFVCRDLDSARKRVAELLSSETLAHQISKKARLTALSYFSPERCGKDWSTLLARFEPGGGAE